MSAQRACLLLHAGVINSNKKPASCWPPPASHVRREIFIAANQCCAYKSISILIVGLSGVQNKYTEVFMLPCFCQY